MKDLSGQGSGEPAQFGYHISPSDAAYLSIVPRMIYVGYPGDIALLTVGGSVLFFAGVAMGTFLPVRAAKVFETGTTAQSLVGLY